MKEEIIWIKAFNIFNHGWYFSEHLKATRDLMKILQQLRFEEKRRYLMSSWVTFIRLDQLKLYQQLLQQLSHLYIKHVKTSHEIHN